MAFIKAFIKEGKTNLIYILISVILAMTVAGNASARPLEAGVIGDYHYIRSEAEIIYGRENSYLNVNCDYGNIKILCDDIEENSGMRPIIHNSASEYCAYGRISKSKYFRGEYYGSYWCVDSSLASKQTQYFDPGSQDYCNGITFHCPGPENDGTPSKAQIEAKRMGELVKITKRLMPIILVTIFLIFDSAFLIWDYLRRKKGKKNSPLLRDIGVTLLVVSIVLFLILVISETAEEGLFRRYF